VADLGKLWRWLTGGGEVDSPPVDATLERPWLRRWDHLPRRSAGFDFGAQDYRDARERAREVARATLGSERWSQLARDRYLDLPSRRYQGVTYRLRIGRRIKVICDQGVRSPWRYPYLCINPTYPLPEEEFLAHLYLYVRDQEERVIQVAVSQPRDQAISQTF
jgi:hypothetical protein